MAGLMTATGGKKLLVHLCVAMGLFAIIWIPYKPSLRHMPRSDQWSVMIDTVHQHHFWEIFSSTYSYPRTRNCSPGDRELFRPVLFGLLAAEKAWFGNNFTLWQAAGILLHFSVCYLMLHVLLKTTSLIQGEASHGEARQGEASQDPSEIASPHGPWLLRLLPYGLVIFFAVNDAVMELVIWSHINGYVLFTVFWLGSLLLLLHWLATPESSLVRRRVLMASVWCLVLLSAFTYEMGQLYAFVLGSALGIREFWHKRFQAGSAVFALFFGVVLIYQGANHVDNYVHRAPPGSIDKGLEANVVNVLERTVSDQTLVHARRYVMYTVVQPFLLSQTSWVFQGRLFIAEITDISLDGFDKIAWTVVAGVVIALGGILTVVAACRNVFARPKTGLLVALLTLSIFGIHMGLIVFGRMNIREHHCNCLSTNSYYTYIPLLAALMTAYCLWTTFMAWQNPRIKALVNGCAAVLLLGLLALSFGCADKVALINRRVRDFYQDTRPFVDNVDRWIRQHRKEPGFSFAFDEPSYSRMESCRNIPAGIVFFSRYLNNHNPKYVISLGNGWQITETQVHSSSQIFPDLIEAGFRYNIYYFEGVYFAVHIDCQTLVRPGPVPDPNLLTDQTLEGVRRQIAAQLAHAQIR